MIFELASRLMTPFLPVETRYRLRQQRIDAESARLAARLFEMDGVSATLRKSVTSTGTEGDVRLAPTHPYRTQVPKWFARGILYWDGTRLGVVGEYSTAAWPTARGGVKPQFGADEIARAGCRPATSGECPASVAEIAAVAVGSFPIRRLYLLDDEGRHVTMAPALGLAEEDVIRLAAHAGIVYRAYSINTGMTGLAPGRLCEALFPRSARRRNSVGFGNDAADWWWPGWPIEPQ